MSFHPPAPTGGLRTALVVSLVAVLASDLAGGAVSVATGLGSWADAWGPQARLAAPLPMVAAQVVLVVVALGRRRRTGVVAAGLLALACGISLVSGFLDGGLADERLTATHRTVQIVLLALTAALGASAAVVAVARGRRSGSGDLAVPTGPLPASTPVLVAGATGQVGRQVVAALLARGAHVRALVRDPQRADLPAGVELVRGDLRDAAGLRAGLDGAGAAFYVSPHEVDEQELAAGFTAACERTGVRLVFAGVHADGLVERLLMPLLLPKYRGKLALAQAISRSPLRPVVLVPSNFMQNDEVFGEELRDGEFVTPINARGVNRIDLRDVGEVAARALVDGDVAPGAYPLVGPRSIGGPGCAAVWAEALGHPVAYTGDDDARMLAAFERRLSGRRLQDWIGSFRVLRRLPVPTSARDLRTTRDLLDREPRSYETYVADVVAGWRTAGVGAQKPSDARWASSQPV